MSKPSLAKYVATGDPDLVNVVIYYDYVKLNKLNRLKILDEADAQKRIEEWKSGDHEENEESSIEVLNTKWKSASWVEQNNILNDTQIVNQTSGQVDIDWTKYRDLRIKTLLIDWDLEYNNQKLPITPEFIDRLPAEVVLALYDKYQRLTVLGADEQGK